MDAKTAESVREVAKSNGIDKALVTSLKSVFYHAEDGNQEILAACEKYPDALYGLATLTPLSDVKGIGYQGLKTGAFKGIRLHPQHHGFNLSDAKRIYEVAEEQQIPVVIGFRLTMNWSLPALSLEDVLALAGNYPRVKFVVSGFNYEILGKLLAHLFPPNLYVETSGFQIVGGVEMLVEILGTDHVMLGTGLPLQFPQSGIQKVLNSKLSKDQSEAVKFRNTAQLFKIKT
jgi:predicted TIM-barrel fold metal-dependent hydrolase